MSKLGTSARALACARLALVCLCAWLAACAAEPAHTAPRALRARIVNGVSDEGRATVVLLMAGTKDCTGALIAPRYVLTAAHCVWRVATPEVFVRFGAEPYQASFEIPAARLVTHPEYDATRLRNDVAIVELERDAPHPPELLLPARTGDGLATGQSVTVFGYGRVRTTGPDDDVKRRSVELTVGAVDPREVVIPFGPGGWCRGDSGGPVVRAEADGRAVLVGVVSSTLGACETGRGYAMRVAAYREFIDAALGGERIRDAGDPPAASRPDGRIPAGSDACATAAGCGECTAIVGCGYCPGSGCVPGTAAGPDGAACAEWAWDGAECELGSPTACGPGERACPDRCVPEEWLCDGQPDCSDGSDEASCGTSEPATVTCDTGFVCDARCLPFEWVCDGVSDCADALDEAGCPSAPACDADTDLACDGRCVPASWACDGVPDCSDGTDEAGCAPSTSGACDPASEIACDGRCVPASWACDGVPDCSDGTDEAGCASP